MKHFNIKGTGALKCSNNVTSVEAKMVRKMADLCLKEMSKKEHEINCSYRHMKNLCRVFVKCKGQRSFGGANEITIDMSILRFAKSKSLFKNYTVQEYSAFCNDPVIGSIKCKNEYFYLFCIVAHEVAHHIQYQHGPWTRWLKKKYKKPHGEGFQDIYRILRSRLVNPMDDKLNAIIRTHSAS